MSYAFISHASEDKRDKVIPLLRAMGRCGLKLWIDRPSFGENDFRLLHKEIEEFGAGELRLGLDFKMQLKDALRESTAVVVCLSKAIVKEREVWYQEITIGDYENKLIPVVVDDVTFEELPKKFGLVDASDLQNIRLNPNLLNEAIDWLKDNPNRISEELPKSLLAQWEIVLKVVRDVRHLEKGQLRQKVPEANVPKIAMRPETCFSFLDREVQMSRTAKLNLPTSSEIVPFVIAGKRMDWPEAFALRLQTLAPNSKVINEEHICIEWPPDNLRSKAERVANLEMQIANAGAAGGIENKLDTVLRGGCGRIVIPYLIDEDDWLNATDIEVYRLHVDWLRQRLQNTSSYTNNNACKVVILFVLIPGRDDRKLGFLERLRGRRRISAEGLAASIPDAESLMREPQVMLAPISQEDIDKWGSHLEPFVKVDKLRREHVVKLYRYGEDVLKDEEAQSLPLLRFYNQVVKNNQVLSMFESGEVTNDSTHG